VESQLTNSEKKKKDQAFATYSMQRDSEDGSRIAIKGRGMKMRKKS